MPVLDRREPGVYVTIEDASYVAETIFPGRSVFCVGACPKGPHNRIVELTSQAQFQKWFGDPDYKRTSMSHYCMDKAMQFTSQGMYIRIVPENAIIANAAIRYNNFLKTIGEEDSFFFEYDSYYVFVKDEETYKLIQENDKINADGDDPAIYSTLIVEKMLSEDFAVAGPFEAGDPDDYYGVLRLYMPYEGTTTDDGEGVRADYITQTEYDIGTSAPNSIPFTFYEGDNAEYVCVKDDESYNAVRVGDWIYAQDDDSSCARQVVAKTRIIDESGSEDDINDTCCDTASAYGQLTLNQPYVRATTGWVELSAGITVYEPYVVDSFSNMLAAYKPEEIVASDTVYSFAAIGAGKYYNKLRIKGTRNVELEKMYTWDEDIDEIGVKEGEVQFPYLFMSIGIYEETTNGNDRLLEGPFLVSLVRQNPDGMKIRELSSGKYLFIEDVINNESELITMSAGPQLDQLSLPYEDDYNNLTISNQARLHVMQLLSTGTPVGTNLYTPVNNSVPLMNGFDGTTDGTADGINFYDESTGFIYIDSHIEGLAAQAYNASFTSYDGSIEQLPEVTYPWYLPDYIISGGWSALTQDAARQLAWYRQDCFHLADIRKQSTNWSNSYDDDLDARLNDFPWNNWTSMLYPQFRLINDPYTGDKIWMTPVYHAIANHLSVDANYFIAEPVAGIEKGAITEPIVVAYRANHTERGDLIDVELNPTIVEPDGKYFLQQFTTWKRLSILKRAHAAKFICYCRKMIPPLLKDILMRKATPFWLKQAESRVTYFLNNFTNRPVDSMNVLEWFKVNVQFDDVASELNIYVDMKPIRVIERINVWLIIH